MSKTKEQRREQRLHYHWPLRFTKDFGEPVFEGRMVDVCSKAASFTCNADENCPFPGQQITLLFSVPHSGSGMVNLVRVGRIRRVEPIDRFTRRVAVRFAQPLPFKPIEVAGSEFEAKQRLEAVMTQ